MKTYALTTLGCPKNQADSRQMEQSLKAAGFVAASHPEDADLHLINSCAFVEAAREETIQTVLEAADLKKRPEQKLILVGCFSERYAEAVEQELPEVDFCFGTGKYDQAGPLLLQKFGPVSEPVSKGAEPQAESSRLSYAEPSHWAPLKISEGCNRGCSFCAIPLMRGSFQSLPKAEIVQEAHRLVAEGVRELCLVSQDTNHFGGSPSAFVDLLCELNSIEDLRWLRLLYMYPDSLTLKIFREIAGRDDLSKLVPYLESPVQHVSKSVLEDMRRYGSFEKFRDFFSEIRELVPEIEIRTSFLVGFPTETEADADELIRFLHEIRPEKLSLFSYSQEEDTTGYELGDPLSSETKAERINRIREAHIEVLKEIHKNRIGKIYECMMESIDSDQTMVVRRPQDAPEIDELVFVEGAPSDSSKNAPKVGDLLRVRITGYYEYDMTAEVALET